MYKRILLATDGSELALHAAEHGIALAKRIGASVVALYASPPFDAASALEFIPATTLPLEVYTESTRTEAARHLDAVRVRAEAAGVACSVQHFRSLSPPEAIVAVALAKGCDLVVIGSHGRGAIGQLWLGSVTTRVLATSSVPVLVYRDAPRPKPRARKS